MQNIERLGLFDVKLSTGFLQPDLGGPHAQAKLLPSLRFLLMAGVLAIDGWRPLTRYLAHQASDGQAVTLRLEGVATQMCSEVAKEIQGFVKEFDCRVSLSGCRQGHCHY
jgi:hypothetical protein